MPAHRLPLLVADVVPSQTIGLDSQVFTLFLVGLALAVFLWGFERYRTSFSKGEFLVSILLALGIFLAGTFPVVYGALGAALSIERRSLVVSVLANTALIALVLYLFARVRNNQLSISELTRRLSIDRAAAELESAAGGITVVVPAYNEAESIVDVVASIPDRLHDRPVRTVVVSDGSTDETAARVEATGAILVEHPLNQGQGGALRTGFEIASQQGAEVVVTMDADGQHPADQLDRLVAPVVADEADYVVGSRYLGTDDSGNGVTRRTGIRTFTTLINLMTKADVSDCTNGFRAIRGSALDDLTLTEERFSAPELIIEARKNGLRIQEVPVEIAAREAGETKKPKLGYAVGLFRTIVTTWVR